MKKIIAKHAFTLKYDGISNILITNNIEIVNPINNKSIQANAIWDTGATGTALTNKLILALGLVPTGLTVCQTANGIRRTDTFDISLKLKSDLIVTEIVATNVGDLSGNMDVIIGMDVINLGDFVITNFNRRTTMTFRIPSLYEIDYVREIEQKNKIKNLHLERNLLGPNVKCLCGSGRAYKNCHGI